MENRDEQILSEIRSTIASIKIQLESLEEMVASLSMNDKAAEEEAVAIDFDLADVMDFETMQDSVEEQVVNDYEEVAEEVVEEGIFAEVVEETVEVEKEKAEPILDAAMETVRTAVIDTMTAKEAWRTDMPGSPVRDIRSAISLNDRILFINTLFDEDPVLFQSILTRINSMSCLDEALEFLKAERPSWNMESDEVYRFMMALRRRIQ